MAGSDQVHRTHCCARHGCKYGKGTTCPVEGGRVLQDHPCERCGEPVEMARDVLRDFLNGDGDFDEHCYITCSDDEYPNAASGCPRCIVIQFAEGIT